MKHSFSPNTILHHGPLGRQSEKSCKFINESYTIRIDNENGLWDNSRIMKNRDVLLLVSPVPQNRMLGISRFAKAHRWSITIGERSAPPTEWRGDGALVMLRDDPVLVRFVRSLVRRGISVVDLSAFRPDIPLPRVVGDNLAIGRLAAEHFLAHNFAHAAFFASRHTPVHDQRYRGFCDGFAGRDAPPFWNRTTLAKGLAAAKKKPLGVFCYSDYDATLALNACLSHGLNVPDDVAILGVDNNEIICENQTVPLSSVLHDHEEIGFRGAELLNRLMGKKGTGIREEGSGRGKPPVSILISPQRVVQRQSTDITATDDPILRHALDYIDAHVSTSFGLSQVADALEMPAYRLGELFRMKLGRSVGKEIIRQKIVRARKLLEETEKPVKEIASETGFCNIAYFVNTFRRETGETPRRYRSRLR